MTWYGWLLLGYWASGVISAITMIGKERDPLTPGRAAVVVAILSLLMWGLLAVGTHQ